MKLSILIPTVNNIDYLSACVASIRETIHNDYELLVFANQANPQMIDYLKTENFTYSIQSENNCGISYPCNHLATRATGDIIMYIGDDYIFAPGWDKAILDAYNPDIFFQYMTFCVFEPKWNNKCENAPRDYGQNIQTFDKINFYKNWYNDRKITHDIISPWGPPIMSKQLWDDIGGFNINYPIFASDSDMAARIYLRAKRKKMPYEFRGLSNCGVYHFQCISTGRLKNVSELQMQAKQQFYTEWKMWPMDLYDSVLGAGKPIL